MFDPATIVRGGVGRIGVGQAEAFDTDDGTDPLREHAGIDASRVRAHAVPQQVDGLVGLVDRQQHVDVCDVIREPVAIGSKAGLTEAAEVRRDHEPLLLQLVDHELKRSAGIAPSVQQDQQRIVPIAPFVDVISHAADVMPLRDGFNFGRIDL